MKQLLNQLDLQNERTKKIAAIIASLLLVVSMVWYVLHGRDQYFTLKQNLPTAPALAAITAEGEGQVLGTVTTEQPTTTAPVNYENPLSKVYINPFK